MTTTTTTISKTAALRQARLESTMYRLGRRWIVMSYDGVWECRGLGFAFAVRALAALRAVRAFELMGRISAEAVERRLTAEYIKSNPGTADCD